MFHGNRTAWGRMIPWLEAFLITVILVLFISIRSQG
jgi:hypothetical protein